MTKRIKVSLTMHLKTHPLKTHPLLMGRRSRSPSTIRGDRHAQEGGARGQGHADRQWKSNTKVITTTKEEPTEEDRQQDTRVCGPIKSRSIKGAHVNTEFSSNLYG